ncbi:hypothetical protein ANOM_000330 [Aspergillus nomiae NRRL 13137]|uniref:Uncharacterized protein n=1 Tax=Aspergillus nomiae NRRL (strain ATCC 15546 / NRRL 13137 / CBS 260.88 / M93) TaxID=1509407 RepID=A0A0L1JHM0_ASPN3|nr:uncharacterized protein ANOM_000330 [Aspergillus nomiae NRRL 13137]KNG91256.1 hypothetical protein ANOM_000330 [Aspergillus nomiae NRRL 13137]
MPFSGTLLSIVAVMSLLAALYTFLRGAHKRAVQQTSHRGVNDAEKERHLLHDPIDNLCPGVERTIDYYRSLFSKLHNIEDHQDMLPEARELLLSLLSEAIAINPDKHRDLFAIDICDEGQLLAFLHDSHKEVGEAYTKYIQGRKAGGPRILAGNREQAVAILTQMAPLKLVDGAWLGHMHHITTLFELRHITKQVWQVLSEELGDGSLHLHHAYIYHNLLCDLGVRLPAPYEPSFIDPAHQMKSLGAWKAAVVQLLISLFPDEFLPEILGYNLHFEGLNLETMVLSRELQELKLDAQYFLLHVSIDNAHSGHAMMAAHTVTEYLSHIRKNEGSAAANTAWKRIQAGYALSAHQSQHLQRDISSLLSEGVNSNLGSNETVTLEVDTDNITKLLADKAAVSSKLHSGCRARIGGKPLAEWLESSLIRSKSEGRDALHELSNASPWVVKGAPERSRLIRELEVGGKMFGAFTMEEVEHLKTWIVSLGQKEQRETAYWDFTGRSQNDHDRHTSLVTTHLPLASYPVASDITLDETIFDAPLKSHPIPSSACNTILPLWFAHISLLESVVSIPTRVASELGAAIVRALRAQYNFSPESDGVTGMDEVNRAGMPDLVDIGIEIIARQGFAPLPRSISDVLSVWPSTSAEMLLSTSKAPVRNLDVLLGMSLAFLSLQSSVLCSPGFLSQSSQSALKNIIERETSCFRVAYGILRLDSQRMQNFTKGYQIAQSILGQTLSAAE